MAAGHPFKPLASCTEVSALASPTAAWALASPIEPWPLASSAAPSAAAPPSPTGQPRAGHPCGLQKPPPPLHVAQYTSPGAQLPAAVVTLAPAPQAPARPTIISAASAQPRLCVPQPIRARPTPMPNPRPTLVPRSTSHLFTPLALASVSQLGPTPHTRARLPPR